MKELALILPFAIFGFVIGVFTRDYTSYHQEKYFMNICIDNNMKYSEADRLLRCERAHQLFTNKEQNND